MSFFNFVKITNNKSVLGIDMGSSSIKVVELKKEKGIAVLKAYGEISLGPYAKADIGSVTNVSNDKISEALRDVLREAGIKTKESGVAIPFKSSLVSLIEMPALSEKKLEEIIPIEARKYIPVPISEVTLDWWIVPKEKYDEVEKVPDVKDDEKKLPRISDKTDVLLVSIHNEILSNYNNIVKDNGLETSFFEIEMFSAARALVNRNEKPVMIFDIGALGTKIYIIEQGIIRASHIINKGSQDITQSISKAIGISFAEAEKIKRNILKLKEEDKKTISEVIDLTMDYIWSETRSIMASFQRRHGKHIDHVIMTGGGASLSGCRESAESNLNVKVELGNPFGKVSTQAYIASALKETGHEFAVAVGAAIRKLEELS